MLLSTQLPLLAPVQLLIFGCGYRPRYEIHVIGVIRGEVLSLKSLSQ